ncbi:unnamed protein product [Pleuronectes platessa]|uniref:Alkylated DNA repair protein AlkB homologue 8 N-terminal domain-containing protein n=1 Tax=Pleuronectes platessa TaxID=8262 RepID=A0A9N7UIZ2_PLEPL|nr:unnamed protein product [Pleuronectes platessa]
MDEMISVIKPRPHIPHTPTLLHVTAVDMDQTKTPHVEDGSIRGILASFLDSEGRFIIKELYHHITAVKIAQQRLDFLRILRKNNLQEKLPVSVPEFTASLCDPPAAQQ